MIVLHSWENEWTASNNSQRFKFYSKSQGHRGISPCIAHLYTLVSLIARQECISNHHTAFICVKELKISFKTLLHTSLCKIWMIIFIPWRKQSGSDASVQRLWPNVRTHPRMHTCSSGHTMPSFLFLSAQGWMWVFHMRDHAPPLCYLTIF